MSNLVDISEALKVSLDSAGLTFEATALEIERLWLPYTERSMLGTAPRAIVVPNSQTTEVETRAAARSIIEIDIFVQRAIDWTDLAEVDAMADLAEDVYDAAKSLVDVTTEGSRARQLTASFDPAVVGEHLTELRIFTSRIATLWLIHHA